MNSNRHLFTCGRIAAGIATMSVAACVHGSPVDPAQAVVDPRCSYYASVQVEPGQARVAIAPQDWTVLCFGRVRP